MRTIYEVSRKVGHMTDICTVRYRNSLGGSGAAGVECDSIGQYRVGDEYRDPTEPDIAGAVDELRKAVEDLVLVVRECPGRPPAYQDAIDHLTIVRHKLGVNR